MQCLYMLYAFSTQYYCLLFFSFKFWIYNSVFNLHALHRLSTIYPYAYGGIYISSIQISKMGNKIALLERWCTTTFSWCQTWGKIIQEKWETKSFVSSIRWPWNAKDDLEFIRSLKIKSIVMCFTNHSLAHALYFTL